MAHALSIDDLKISVAIASYQSKSLRYGDDPNCGKNESAASSCLFETSTLFSERKTNVASLRLDQPVSQCGEDEGIMVCDPPHHFSNFNSQESSANDDSLEFNVESLMFPDSLLHQLTILSGMSSLLDLLATSEEEKVKFIDDFLSEEGDVFLRTLQVSESKINHFIIEGDTENEGFHLINKIYPAVFQTCSEILKKMDAIPQTGWKQTCDQNFHAFLLFLQNNKNHEICQILLDKVCEQTSGLAHVISSQVVQLLKQCEEIKTSKHNEEMSSTVLTLAENLWHNVKRFCEDLERNSPATAGSDKKSNKKGKWSKVFEIKVFQNHFQLWEKMLSDSYKGLSILYPELCNIIWSIQDLVSKFL